MPQPLAYLDPNLPEGARVVLPLLEPPSEFEAKAYYWSFPSQPRLLGRTSSGTTPWWRLSQPENDDTIQFGPYAGLETATMCGPVGTHAIHACWWSSTLPRVRTALASIPWTSIDVLRIGRTEVRKRDRPVIVWVGVSPSRVLPWPQIASALRAVRQALDADGLFNVQCEMRQSEVIKAAGTGPRLVSPQAISTAVGQPISPAHNDTTTGTLGLFLEPASEPGKKRDDDGSAVWALTCHHVALPTAASRTGPPTSMLLPTAATLNSALVKINRVIATHQEIIDESRSSALLRPSQATVQASKATVDRSLQLRDALRSFQESGEARIVGPVHHSPPIAVKFSEGKYRYTSDWALVTLDRAKFPVGYKFDNVVDLQTNTNIDVLCQLVNDHISSFGGRPKSRFEPPKGNIFRLRGIVPRQEMLGGRPAHDLVANHDGDPHLIVLKRGFTTELTAGVVLDIESVTRQFAGGVGSESTEITVVHLSGQRKYKGELSKFSARGDSGAAVFDLRGRIVGMMTGGSGGEDKIDTSYVTYFDFLRREIGQQLKTPVRACESGPA
ncbi:hypothetical protein SCUCBS95973_008884 [Sporothrix curviconia]|uniref:Uncharacterized protein n=1 Tax=Sporothrix curviconia TaxID=1260050 RepID=A0ABP0CR66_9PEZI